MPRLAAITALMTMWIFLAAGSLLAGVTPPASEDRTAPEAVFLKLNHYFDEVYEGVEIKHDFIVENRGNAPLVIKNIRPD